MILSGLLSLWLWPVQVPPAEPEPAPLNLSLVGVGRFANLVDTASLRTGPEGVEIRALQVSETPMKIGDKTYVGGWSWWRFDCHARTADRLDFASLTSDLKEGPSTPEPQPPYPANPGGDAAELLAIACAQTAPLKGETRLDAAIAMARQAMAD